MARALDTGLLLSIYLMPIRMPFRTLVESGEFVFCFHPRVIGYVLHQLSTTNQVASFSLSISVSQQSV
jgi:Na+-translocating ferredoxin:NAD+ oxidoreductase RnfD subunit